MNFWSPIPCEFTLISLNRCLEGNSDTAITKQTVTSQYFSYFEMNHSIHMYLFQFATVISEGKQFNSIFCQCHTLRKCLIWVLKNLFADILTEFSGGQNEMRLGGIFQKSTHTFYSYIKWLNFFGLLTWQDSCCFLLGQYTAFAVLVLHFIFQVWGQEV